MYHTHDAATTSTTFVTTADDPHTTAMLTNALLPAGLIDVYRLLLQGVEESGPRMGTLLGVDHALALPTGRQAQLGGPPRISTSSEPGNHHPNPGPDPANLPPTQVIPRTGWWSG